MYLILGAGGFAGEVACNYLDLGASPNDIVFFDDVSNLRSRALVYRGKTLKFPVTERFGGDLKSFKFTIGVGDPGLKGKLVDLALKNGLKPNVTIIHPTAVVQGVSSLGEGGIITANVVITTNVEIGNYVILNLGATVGHDTRIEDFVTINPLVAISGNCVIGRGAMLGVGSILREGTKVGENSVVGGQAFVSRDVPEGTTVVGVPANQLPERK